MKRFVSGLLVVGLVLASADCIMVGSNAEQGALTGAAGGAIIGGLIGDSQGDALLGAIIGAAIGGAAGAYIGGYMDRQAAEMRDDVEGVEVDRVGEGIRVSFDIGMFFGPGGFELMLSGRNGLARLAIILNQYPSTHIFIEGSPYGPGAPDRDIALSRRRARIMADYLEGQNVRPDRFTVRDYRPGRGRSDSRRLSMAVMADDNLRNAARSHMR